MIMVLYRYIFRLASFYRLVILSKTKVKAIKSFYVQLKTNDYMVKKLNKSDAMLDCADIVIPYDTFFYVLYSYIILPV